MPQISVQNFGPILSSGSSSTLQKRRKQRNDCGIGSSSSKTIPLSPGKKLISFFVCESHCAAKTTLFVQSCQGMQYPISLLWPGTVSPHSPLQNQRLCCGSEYFRRVPASKIRVFAVARKYFTTYAPPKATSLLWPEIISPHSPLQN